MKKPTKAERHEIAQTKFAAQVLAAAQAAGATVVEGSDDKVFEIQTPIGVLRGHAFFDAWIAMRFSSPCTGAPGVAAGDFNPHSYKWNITPCVAGGAKDWEIQFQAAEHALAELDRRLAWATGKTTAAVAE